MKKKIYRISESNVYLNTRTHRTEIVNKPFHTGNYNSGNSASKIQKCIIPIFFLAFIYILDFSISSYTRMKNV